MVMKSSWRDIRSAARCWLSRKPRMVGGLWGNWGLVLTQESVEAHASLVTVIRTEIKGAVCLTWSKAA
jgi:hypothetical protein